LPNKINHPNEGKGRDYLLAKWFGTIQSAICRMITKAVNIISFRQRLELVTAHSLYRNAFYLMLTTAITSLLGFFFWIVVARFYSETEVGYGSAIISVINLIALLSVVGLNFSVIRFLHQAAKPQELINSSLTLCGLASLIIATIFISGIDFWSPALSFVKHNAIFFLAFLVVAVLTTLSNLTDSVFVAKRRAGFVLSKNTIFSLLKIPLPIAFVIFLHTFGVVISWGIALAIALIISLLLFLPRVEDGYKPIPTLNIGRTKGVLQYSGGSYVASLLARAPIMILPLMVLNLLGTESNAYFYVAWMIASLLAAIPRSVSRSLFAEGSYRKENIKENVTRSIKLTFLLLVPAVVVLIIAAKWVLLAFGESYSANALTLLWLLSISSLPRGINHVYIGLLRVQDRLKELIIIQGLVAVAVFTLSLFAISAYGIMGVGYVWLGVQGVVSIALASRLATQVRQFRGARGSDLEDVNHF
jgi:O-antigen/teichoic acid export membrane protein